MNDTLWLIWEVFWMVCGVATIIAAVRASRSSRARLAGRAAVGALFIAGGALLHVINLATGADYATFANQALFGWVTDAWHAVLVPNHVVLIGLLALFEAAVGVLACLGGRRTQLAYAGVIAFYLLLTLFGWIELVWCVVMLPPMLLLLRAEHRAARGAGPAGAEPAERTAGAAPSARTPASV